MRGDITSVAVYAQDITERKRAEAALRESEARFRSYVDHAPHGIFISDETGLYLEVNLAACEISGYAADELLQMHISELWLPEMHALATQHFRHLLETGYASEIAVITYSYHWADDHNHLIRRWDNTPHFPDVQNFPYHVHEESDDAVAPSEPMSIFVVLDEITSHL